ncbi:alpha-amylase family glycosyl hydrolase [Mariniflexile sp. AS56]|uniref:alpha-amylase family glycosyl hydrolase n=1 Tax=Mariniflexile sp. AS56 TaxID=3063957 RepID=UPI0026EE384C|nr:alpha-amylase family glycosyl hydrolase [Mariniflexile sp. AS56]MDO7171726.1 alpha-amylase family glycosyl hydrolase [Mariniflexile sp. AS56]
MKHILLYFIPLVLFLNCKEKEVVISTEKENAPFVWEAANLYFLLTDRFNNGDTANDINFDRTLEAGKLRGFEGGDLKGVTQKIEAGYFTDLGINAIWMTPVVEQIHGATNEGTGLTYGYHGYWASDWTSIDPNFGTKEDLKQLVEAAHKKGIRILLDAVINHTGPVTESDTVWPEAWVRTGPPCDYQSYKGTTACTLVENLPDIKTERNEAVELPPHLVNKWKQEGRFEQEQAELNAFFQRTGYPKAPRFYIMKWLTDYITEFGIDGYRVDTVKHTEPYVWQEFKKECDNAFAEYKKSHPDKVLDTNNFYLVGEVYNYGISAKTTFDFGDNQVNYFDNAFNSLINFDFKWNAAQQDYETVFKRYSSILNSDLKGYSILNYVSSHDDGNPFDAKREKTMEAGTKLLLAPGTSQVYYGDELARSLTVGGTEGDAALRSVMNWDALQTDAKAKAILKHWQKLGRFRANHPAVGAGAHQQLTKKPYSFSRIYSNKNYTDAVVVGLDLPKGEKILDVSKVFKDHDKVHDAYSNQTVLVKKGQVVINSNETIVLLEKE